MYARADSVSLANAAGKVASGALAYARVNKYPRWHLSCRKTSRRKVASFVYPQNCPVNKLRGVPLIHVRRYSPEVREAIFGLCEPISLFVIELIPYFKY